MPSAACEHALTISTSGRVFLHSWDSIWGLEQCNSTRCLPGTGTSAKPYRYSSHLFPRAEKRAVCSAIRRHFLQGVLMMSAHLGSPFAHFVNIASCTAQQMGICCIFRKTSGNKGLYQTAKKRKVAREPGPNKSKLRFSFFLACFAHFSFCFFWWILDFILIRVPSFEKWPFPRISKEFFFTRLARGFDVVFHWSAAWPRLNEGPKLWIS